MENLERKGGIRGKQKYKTGKWRKLAESRTRLWNVVPKECLQQQYCEDYGFLKSSFTPDEKKQLRHQKRWGECPTNFQTCTCDCCALAYDTQYPWSLFGNEIWKNLEIHTVPLSATRSLLGLTFKSKSLAFCFIEYFFNLSFLLILFNLKAWSSFGLKGEGWLRM